MLGFIKNYFRRFEKHEHEFVYTHRTAGGWAVVYCKKPGCTYMDIC